MTMVFIIPSLLMVFGLLRIAQAALCLPSGKNVEAIRNVHGKREMTERLQVALLPMARLISKLFPMSEYRRKQMEADFARLHMTQKPEDFVSNVKARSLLLALTGLLFIPMGVPFLALLTTVAALLAYFQAMQSIRKRVETQSREIEAELPRLVETMNYTLQDNRDMLSFFEKYRRVAGKALETEIDRYISDYLPAIIPIPGVSGNTGRGMRNVKKSVERAVGSDIIFNS